MIKPEILKMVEECKRRNGCGGCEYTNLCDTFHILSGEYPSNYKDTGIDDGIKELLSFLTSQEVCEWIRIGKEKYHTGCSKGTDITLMQIDLNMIYCPQCGKKIKEVSM